MASQAIKDLIAAVRAFDEASGLLDDLKSKKALADQTSSDLAAQIQAQKVVTDTAKAAMKAAAANV